LKRLFTIILVLTIALSLFGCNVSGISNNDTLLKEAGFSQEQIDAMSDEMRQAILDELGIVAEAESKRDEQQATAKKYTADDVAAGGSYVVTVSDSMGLNTVKLYYENGVLVKVESSFRKNDSEEPMLESCEGDALKEYRFAGIDFDNSTPSQIIDGLTDYGYTHVYIEPQN